MYTAQQFAPGYIELGDKHNRNLARIFPAIRLRYQNEVVDLSRDIIFELNPAI